MTRIEKGRWRAIVAATVLLVAADAFAQDPPAGGIDLESSPFTAPKPGQSQEPSSGLTPRGLNLGRLDWAPIASRCAFVRTDEGGKPEVLPEPGTDEKVDDGYASFVFVTMVADHAGEGQPLERGYVMANGLVRELEKGKTAAGKDGAVVTNWRAAGEPRISVGLVLTGTQMLDDHVEYTGKMTVFWGDKKEEVSVRGRCA
ncbi:MAG: hypothetical protein CMP81_19615 [Fulvimarina sp.]|nr:hypothetical protein [Fulvimarina sp.]